MRLGAVLYVYKGEYGLPSIDFECLRCLCLVKFPRVPIQIETSASPIRSGNGKLPYLQVGNEKFTGYRQIKKFLDKEGYPVDRQLPRKYKPLSFTYTNWVFTNLHAYYNYYMYGEPNNYDTTRSLYAKRTPFPFNFYYPSTYQKEAQDVLLTMGGFDLNDKIDKHETDYLITNAKTCVNTLSKRLGKKVWFFGDNYSEFDVIVYAYLSILFKGTLPNNPLQGHIQGCQNLVNFINRISKDIFRDEAFNSVKTSKHNAGNDPMLTATERRFLESEKQTKVVAGVTAVIAMISFAAWRGLYNQFANHNKSYEGFGYEDEDDLEDDDMD